MIVLAGFALVAVVAMLALKGNPLQIQDLRLRGEGLMLALFVVQAVARGRLVTTVVPRLKWNPVLPWTVAVAGLLVLAICNFRQRGMPVVAAGLAANLLVVVSNGGMPISTTVVGAPELLNRSSLAQPFYVLVTARTRLPFLGDVIKAPSSSSTVLALSAGDLCLLLGVAILLLSVSLRRAQCEGGRAVDSGSR
jgi:Family of unknown function (DUF5317)